MPDNGLLMGLAEGVDKGLDSYRTERSYQDQKRRDAITDRMNKAHYESQLLSAGQVQDPTSGVIAKSDDQKRKEAMEEATKQAGLLKSGFNAEYDPVTGRASLAKVPGFKDTEEQEKLARTSKLKAETYAIEHPAADPAKQPNQAQFAAAGYAKRAEQAENVFSDLSARGFDPTTLANSFSKKLPGFLGGLKSENVQLQDQAERNFVNAILRRESGAAIAQSEFDSAEKQYFPRPGDGPEVLQQKALNRKIVQENLKAEGLPAMGKSPSVQSMAASLPSQSPKARGLLPEATAGEAPLSQGQLEKLSDEELTAYWKKVKGIR